MTRQSCVHVHTFYSHSIESYIHSTSTTLHNCHCLTRACTCTCTCSYSTCACSYHLERFVRSFGQTERRRVVSAVLGRRRQHVGARENKLHRLSDVIVADALTQRLQYTLCRSNIRPRTCDLREQDVYPLHCMNTQTQSARQS